VFISSNGDQDADGIPDDLDNCPSVFNPSQADMDADGIGDACDLDADGDGFTVDQDCNDFDPTTYFNAPELCDGLDNDCDGTVDEGCNTCDPFNITTNMDVVEIGFGTSNPRVNATWNNPNGTTDCQVRGGRIAPSSIGTGTPVFANINNTQILSQTNGSTLLFNVALYNNPNVPFVIGQTYGYEVRCLCADGTAYINWSGIIPEATLVVPPPPAGVQHNNSLALKAVDASSLILYPNPNGGEELMLGIEYTGGLEGIANVQVMDITGKTIWSERIPVKGEQFNTLINFQPRLTTGMYIASVDMDGIILRKKFIVE
jgi:hypothetical protein